MMKLPQNIIPLTEKNKANFWDKVDKNGPIPDQSNLNYSGLGQCWLWRATCDDKGYGMIAIRRRMKRAHRVSWAISFGGTLENMCVLHKCDNPSCINPQHLFLGTLKDNAEDREFKGRGNHPSGNNHPLRKNPSLAARGDANGARKHRERMRRGDDNGARKYPERLLRGEKNNKAKLTVQNVKEIRLRHSMGENCVQLGDEFGVCYTSIRRIVNHKSWAHVP